MLSGSEVAALYDWAPGPIAYYPLDEGAGVSTVYDRSGNGYNGTMSSLTEDDWVPGKFGSALDFDRANDDVNIADNDVFSVNWTNQFTVAGWVRFKSLGTRQEPFTKGSTSLHEWIMRKDSSTDLPVAILLQSDGTTYMSASGPTALTSGRWYHLAFTADLNTPSLKLYVDGVMVAEDTTASGTYTNNTAAVRLGERADGSNDTDGTIDDVRIYNYARSQKQIIQDMNAGHPGVGSPVGSPLGYWRFDEGYGDTANNTGSQGSTLNGDLQGTCPGGASCPTWQNDGKLGKALAFDGGDYVNLSSEGSMFSTNSFTYSVWINPVSTGTSRIFLDNRDGGDDGTAFYVSPGDNLDCLYNSTSSGTYALTMGVWTHVVCTSDGSTLSLYVNGIKRSSASISGDISESTNARIGARSFTSATNFYNGLLDELKVYNFALTSDEVKLEYNQGKSLVLGALSQNSSNVASNSASTSYCVSGDTTGCSSPILEYIFDEGIGTSTVYDRSPTGNNGTMNGSMTNDDWVPGKHGSGLDLDGSDDYIAPASAPSISATGSWTYSIWLFIRSYTNGTGTNGSGTYFIDRTTSSTPLFDLKAASDTFCIQKRYDDNTGLGCGATGSSGIKLNTWTQVAMVRDGTNFILYVDGRRVNSGGDTGGAITLPIPKLGIHQGGAASTAFNGVMDDFKIYDYARTPAQVAWEYSRGGPIAWYKFDECEGTSVYNTATSSGVPVGTLTHGGSGNTAAGTCTSGTSTHMWYNGATGKYNSSLDFDGTNDFVNLSNDLSILASRSAAITMSAWIKPATCPANLTAERVVNGIIDAANTGFIIAHYDDSCSIYVGGRSIDSDSLLNTTTLNIRTVPLNTWSHILGIVDYSNDLIKIYIDGQKITESTAAFGNNVYAFGTPTGGATDSIGARHTGGGTTTERFDGLIDDVRVFNYGLTDSQIKTLYNENKSVRFGPSEGNP